MGKTPPRHSSCRRGRRDRSAVSRWTVRYLPGALEEKEAIRDSAEIKAIDRVVDKLKNLGPELCEPHQRHVRGSRQGLRELRPRAGRSRWRPIYWRATRETFVIGAVAPEVETDKRGYRRGVRHAEDRKAELEAARAEEKSDG